ncbi:peptidoglycan DD-metalloendopeptidase family protein [Brevundimonas sp. Root1279]|uniref:peptidoglycan DD-metalloendopeptidase family protein n=1 Tax=Brevundimonas sp. Root1279 TaxID=1736443 RepID=UPI0012E368BD|nr:peptidoglycan DD-metalloendopeptidase family protein [Brevundimonas sp. Root1279]
MAVASAAAACSSYPSEPRYSIYADAAPAPMRAPTYPTTAAPAPTGEGVRGATNPANEAPLPSAAPVASIEGGSLDAPVSNPGPQPYSSSPPTTATAYPTAVPAAGPASEGFSSPPPPARNGASAVPATAAAAGVAYEIQPGDTISGVGRRFQTPIQTLIDLNQLGPQASVRPGQRLLLPANATDIGGDPYATGPSPFVEYAAEVAPPPPPPPPPPVEMAPPPPPARQPVAPPSSASTPAATATTVALDWPVRGDILRRFGPVGMGEKNNGVNIGAPAGAEVRASAGGRVGYVGDDLAGQGLTVLLVHRDGWRSVYGHLGSTTVRDGDEVQPGQQIGTVGTTAGDGRPSIHFETWRMYQDEPRAIDPLTVLPR